MKHLFAPINSSTQYEDNYKLTQLKTIFSFLKENLATASMVAKATNVPHKNITRYKRDLELAGKVWEVKKDYCELTGHKAWYISADLSFKPNSYNQLSLFNDLGGMSND
jgi:hypothetical protein